MGRSRGKCNFRVECYVASITNTESHNSSLVHVNLWQPSEVTTGVELPCISESTSGICPTAHIDCTPTYTLEKFDGAFITRSGQIRTAEFETRINDLPKLTGRDWARHPSRTFTYFYLPEQPCQQVIPRRIFLEAE